MAKIKPLQNKTMTLHQLQVKTLNVIRLVKFQLHRQAHEDGMSDAEFIEEVLDPLETQIVQDRIMKRMIREKGGNG